MCAAKILTRDVVQLFVVARDRKHFESVTA